MSSLNKSSRALALWLSMLPAVASAHHSIAVFYDRTTPGELEGEVTGVFWRNPHIRFRMNVLNDAGQKEAWTLEAADINSLARGGIDSSPMAVGDRITVRGWLSSHGRNALFVNRAVLADGQEIVMGFERRVQDTDAADAAAAERLARGIYRVWSIGQYPQTTASYTDEALATRAEWDPYGDDTALQCIPQGMPGIMVNPYPIEFLDAGDELTLRVEEWDTVRTIHLNGDQPPETLSRLGYSRGRWEDNVLVVETSGIDWIYFDDIGTPKTDAMEVVERFTLSEDNERLDYSATITDPAIFTEPAHFNGHWTWVPGEEVKPFDCANPG